MTYSMLSKLFGTGTKNDHLHCIRFQMDNQYLFKNSLLLLKNDVSIEDVALLRICYSNVTSKPVWYWRYFLSKVFHILFLSF